MQPTRPCSTNLRPRHLQCPKSKSSKLTLLLQPAIRAPAPAHPTTHASILKAAPHMSAPPCATSPPYNQRLLPLSQLDSAQRNSSAKNSSSRLDIRNVYKFR
ncbi:hypothetical protein SDJN03_21669, partial [Cucurbita argyrosperma subsp. sororia]